MEMRPCLQTQLVVVRIFQLQLGFASSFDSMHKCAEPGSVSCTSAASSAHCQKLGLLAQTLLSAPVLSSQQSPEQSQLSTKGKLRKQEKKKRKSCKAMPAKRGHIH
eukprot:939245-Pelagomonas_calceolata.AAC.1